jgi:hypothetical protein
VRLTGDAPKLAGDGVRHLGGDVVHGGLKGEAGAQRVAHEVSASVSCLSNFFILFALPILIKAMARLLPKMTRPAMTVRRAPKINAASGTTRPQASQIARNSSSFSAEPVR